MVDERATLVPAIMFVVWACTKAGVPRSWAPIVALVLGIAAGIWSHAASPMQGVLAGILYGAAAVGFNSGAKHTVQAVRSRA